MSGNKDNAWIQSVDPTTGRIFYANKRTRTTQWDAPPGWNGGDGDGNCSSPLPDGWEEMRDPKTNRRFYVDHLRRETTWDRPSAAANGDRSVSSPGPSSSAPTGTLNRRGFHSEWADDPRRGSRRSPPPPSSRDPPLLSFASASVPDAMRPSCPSCRSPFSYVKRRHHCRLCGDVFCDGCSSGRAVLPLEGDEFRVAVRVCDGCLVDVKRGNYFSWRRYLTPLQLYDGRKTPAAATRDGSGSGDKTREITLDTVAASLSSLSVDVDAILSNPEEDRITLPAEVLVPAVGRHLKRRETAEYAIRVLAGLVALGSVVGDDSFASAICGIDRAVPKVKRAESTGSMISASSEESPERRVAAEPAGIADGILDVLELSGEDGRTVGAMERAACVLFYITEPSLIANALSRGAEEKDGAGDGDGATNGGKPVDVDAAASIDDTLQLDLHRAFRAMLDHATNSSSPSLQRWATATLRNLITEDQRRACALPTVQPKYESFASQLVSTGAITILCSLLGSDDAETRTNAASALEGSIVATREIDVARNSQTNEFYRVGRATKADSRIVNAIVSNGGCGPALSHLLMSADESVAMKACEFALALISPLLTDPKGSALKASPASYGVSFESVDDGLNSYRKAALVLVVGEGQNTNSNDVTCLPALVQILRSAFGHSYATRSIKLQVVAAKCLAAIALAVGHIQIAAGSGMIPKDSTAYQHSQVALTMMEKERLHELAYVAVTSPTLNSLDPSRSTPQSCLREAAGLILYATVSCSSIAATYLTSNRAISELLRTAGDSGMLTSPSAIRGEWASRGLCYLETSASLMINACKQPKQAEGLSTTLQLDLLIDALDSGAIGLASHMIKAKVNLQNHDIAHSQICVKIACCSLLSAMFEIANADEEVSTGKARLYSAIDADCAASLASDGTIDSRTSHMTSTSGRSDIVASTIALLRATVPYALKIANNKEAEPLPMVDLSEACLLAVGGMCGAQGGSFASATTGLNARAFEDQGQDKYSYMKNDACVMAFDALRIKVERGELLPAVLIGFCGESCIVPMLRLALTIAQNGDLRGELVRTGVLVPVGDMLQAALLGGNRYTFSLCAAIIRFCGPVTSAGNMDTASNTSLKNAIRTLSLILTRGGSSEKHRAAQSTMQLESVKTLEALSANETLLITISEVVLPAITEFLPAIARTSDDDEQIYCALNIVNNLASAPTHSVSVAKSGIISIIVQMTHDHVNANHMETDTILSTSVKLFHNLASPRDSMLRQLLLSNGVINVVTEILQKPDGIDTLVRMAFETVSLVVSGIFSSPREEEISRLVYGMRGKDIFFRRVIATVIACEQEHILEDPKLSIRRLYGDQFPDDLAGTATKLLFQITCLFCTDADRKAYFYNVVMLPNVDEAALTVVVACCTLLGILRDAAKHDFVPNEPRQRLLVRKFLFEGLVGSMNECGADPGSSNSLERIICALKVPQMCLVFCQTDELASEAFALFEAVEKRLGVETLGQMLIQDKSSLLALFDVVTAENCHVNNKRHAKTCALLLGTLAKEGLLSDAVMKYDLKSHAIAALSAAIVLDGDNETIIDEDESSLPRICVDCLVSLLCTGQGQIKMTPLEARAMATAIGKSLSLTVLDRLFTQATREATLHDSHVNHSIDRKNIFMSSESRLLCAMASYAEALDILRKVGGLEAISLIAHDGEIAATRALKKACEMDPTSITSVDAHLSVIDALLSTSDKLSTGNHDLVELREVVTNCFSILASLAASKDTRSAMADAERIDEVLTVATCLIAARSDQNSDKSIAGAPTDNTEENHADLSHAHSEELLPELQLNDSVLVNPNSSKNGSSSLTQLEGVIAHIGPVQFAPGSDWIGIRLTGSSKGLGKNNGAVKGICYFNCENENDGVFVKKENVKRQQLPIDTSVAETELNSSVTPSRLLWGHLLSNGDSYLMEKAALSLLSSSLSSKHHRDKLLAEGCLIDSLLIVVQTDSTHLDNFQCDALRVLSECTIYTIPQQVAVTELLVSVVTSQTKAIQVSRNSNETANSKNISALAVVGLQNLYCTAISDHLKVKSIKACSDLFVYLVDFLFVGPKSQRSIISFTDCELFCNLMSLCLLAIGSDETRSVLVSTRHISSLVRFIVMSARVDDIISIGKCEGAEFFDTAMQLCLIGLSYVSNEGSMEKLGRSISSLIQEVESSPGLFVRCLEQLSSGNFGGASHVAASQLLSKLNFV